MIKRILAFIIALFMIAISLFSCKLDNENGANDESNENEYSTYESQSAPLVTQKPTDKYGQEKFSSAIPEDLDFDSSYDFELLHDDTYAISGYQWNSSKKIVVPDEYNGKPVTRISDGTFYECDQLEEVILPETIKIIGDSVFYGCVSLVSLTLPNSIVSIGNDFIYGCANIITVTMPMSLKEFGSGFTYCNSLVEVVNNSSVDIVLENVDVHNGKSRIVNNGGCLFYNKDNVNYLVNYIGDSNILNLPDDFNGEEYRIRNRAFTNCRFDKIIIPNTFTRIDDGAFSGCDVKEIIIPDGVIKIGKSAFSGVNVKNIIIPDSVKIIGSYAFSNCYNIESIIIPKGVTNINSYTFKGCTLLKEVILPDSIVKIDNEAFFACESLESVIIPDSVSEIGVSAFEQCYALTSVEIKNDWELDFGITTKSISSTELKDKALAAEYLVYTYKKYNWICN